MKYDLTFRYSEYSRHENKLEVETIFHGLDRHNYPEFETHIYQNGCELFVGSEWENTDFLGSIMDNCYKHKITNIRPSDFELERVSRGLKELIEDEYDVEMKSGWDVCDIGESYRTWIEELLSDVTYRELIDWLCNNGKSFEDIIVEDEMEDFDILLDEGYWKIENHKLEWEG